MAKAYARYQSHLFVCYGIDFLPVVVKESKTEQGGMAKAYMQGYQSHLFVCYGIDFLPVVVKERKSKVSKRYQTQCKCHLFVLLRD